MSTLIPNTQFVNSMLSTKATGEINEQIKKELDISDPKLERAVAMLNNELQQLSEDDEDDDDLELDE